jgi:tRNA modification GTPase
MCLRLLEGSEKARQVRDGFRIAIVGAPNAGKSSLLNRLAQSDVAIVSPIAGTTRDVIEVRVRLAGQLVLISDTAGIRPTDDQLELAGIQRAEAKARDADLRIIVSERIDGLSDFRALEQAGDLRVWTKADLRRAGVSHEGALSVSSETGEGVDALLTEVASRIGVGTGLEEGALTRIRHVDSLREAALCLERALQATGAPAELVIEELRLAARALGRVTGRIGVEDVLDAIFAQFCIGK